MRNESTKSRAKLLPIGVLVATAVVGVVSGIEISNYKDRYNSLQDYTLINPESIIFEYSKKQYSDAVSEAEIEFRLKALSARVSLTMTTLLQLDAFYDSDTKSFTDTQFTEALLYCDWVNYGDPEIKASNTLEGKCLILNNAIDTLNYYNEEVNVFIYDLGNTKVSSYKHIWEGLNKDTKALNELIVKYNKENKTDFVRIHEIKSIGE